MKILSYPDLVVSAQVTRMGLLMGLLLIAFGLRVHKITSVPLSLDEIITISRYVPLPVIDIFTTYHSNNHTLASILAHLFSPQADHLFMLRWPSIILGMLALPFFYRLGLGLFKQKIAILGLALLATTPVYLGYSMIVRGYIGFISLAVISYYFLWKALQKDRWIDLGGALFASILMAFFHLFGVLAGGLTLGLAGVWRLGQVARQVKDKKIAAFWRFAWPQMSRYFLIVSMLAIFYLLFIYTRTASVLGEGGYDGEFEVWRNGLSWPEDLSPLIIFVGLLGPLSPGQMGGYIFLAFAIVGWVQVWKQQPFLGLLALIWFTGPFLLIYVAMMVLGRSFYAYARFLLYLLPPVLLLTSVGMVKVWNDLSNLTNDHRWSIPVNIVRWLAVVGLLALILNSLNWYTVRATHADWPQLAETIAQHRQPADITICEEYQRGLAAPDRAKPYCLWMIDFFTGLKGYTPQLQNSTDLVANYAYLQQQRAAMLSPGGVWLVVWPKVVFNVEHLITDEKPVVASLPPSAGLAPYQKWRFGSAMLVYINSEETLYENTYKAVELLLQLNPTPPAKARYYRSLADLEAFRGRKESALAFFEQSWAMVEETGGEYPQAFLKATQQAIDRIPNDAVPPATAYQIGYRISPNLCLSAYSISPDQIEAGNALILTLYWQALGFIDEDYTFFLGLDDPSGQRQGKLEFQPFDRTYPTPWWWAGQRLVENRQFVIPPDLPIKDYVVNLGAYVGQPSDTRVAEPLFLMRYKEAAGHSGYWQIEAIDSSSSLQTCLN